MIVDVNKVKISVTMPSNCVAKIRDAICELGAGNIGNYSHCSYSIKCKGTFTPNDYAKPFIGENNKLKVVNEEMLEIICNINIVKQVVTKIREIHPYEEPVINIIPLIDENIF